MQDGKRGVQYLALLRGINVGGKNAVAMAELRDEFEQMGFDDVATYINSGNVLFRAPRQGAAKLAARIEKALTKRFGIELKVVLQTEAQLRAVVDAAPPKEYGTDKHRSDVIFLRKPLTPAKAFGVVELKEGVDRVLEGQGRPLLLAPRRKGDEQPHGQDRRHARVPGHDDPQLEHDDEAACADGREERDGRPSRARARVGSFSGVPSRAAEGPGPKKPQQPAEIPGSRCGATAGNDGGEPSNTHERA